MKKIIFFAIIFAACSSSKTKEIKVNTSAIELGNIEMGDSTRYKIVIKNLSTSDSVSIKGISASCSCMIIDSKIYTSIPPNDSITLNGVFDTKRSESGAIDQSIAIHTDAINPFVFVKIKGVLK